jgi:DNA-binding transcriptional regulator YiaG
MITASQIKEARKHVEETQTEFCVRLGVDQSTLSRWEENGPPDHGPTQVALESVISPILRRKAKTSEGAAA